MAKADFLDISMLGDKKLQRKLKRIDISLQRRGLRMAMRKGMTLVKNRARQLAPYKTGALKKSIKVKQRSRRGISSTRVVTGTRAELNIDPGEKYYYPAVLEYGGRQVPAKSFMRAALAQEQVGVIKTAAIELDRHIKKVARR